MKGLPWLRTALLRLLLPIAHAINGYKKAEIGSVTFRGADEFLDLCRGTMLELEKLDTDVFSRIKSGRRTELIDAGKTFYYDEITATVFVREDFINYRHQGIISLLLFAHFVDAKREKDRSEGASRYRREIYREAAMRVADRCRCFGFSPHLAELFDKWWA